MLLFVFSSIITCMGLVPMRWTEKSVRVEKKEAHQNPRVFLSADASGQLFTFLGLTILFCS